MIMVSNQLKRSEMPFGELLLLLKFILDINSFNVDAAFHVYQR